VSRHARRSLGLALLVNLAILTGCTGSNEGGDSGFVISDDRTITRVPAADREPAPDLFGELVGGGSFALADVRGDDIVVVNVWGSWCGPCRAEAATLERVSQDLADDGVQFLGLNTRDQEAAALAFLRRFDVTYPNLDDTDAQLQLAFRDSLPSASIPTTWVIDRRGRVAAQTISGVTEERLRAMIEPVLAETP